MPEKGASPVGGAIDRALAKASSSVPEVLGVDKFGATLRALGWHATLGTWFSSVLEEAARNLVNLPTNPRMIMQKSISLDAYRGNPPVAPLSAVEVVSST
jgi:hypothetical protein